jgi:hypothetical protein
MCTTSIQELTGRVHIAMRAMEEADLEAARHEVGSDAVAFRQALKASIVDYVAALRRSIASKKERATYHDPLALIRERKHQALMDVVALENSLGVLDGTSIMHRWNLLQAAKLRVTEASDDELWLLSTWPSWIATWPA